MLFRKFSEDGGTLTAMLLFSIIEEAGKEDDEIRLLGGKVKGVLNGNGP